MARTVPSRMLSVIEENGWWKGDVTSQPDTAQCPISAVYLIDDSTAPELHQAYDVIADVIREKYSDGPWMAAAELSNVSLITRWNDNPGTKITHLRKVLREASKRLRSA